MTIMSIKPIQTNYQNVLFRSRLEARWARFFDILKIDWQYEPEGFSFSSGAYYLPDFYLPVLKLWVEIKPFKIVPPWHRRPHDIDPNQQRAVDLCRNLADSLQQDVVLIGGQPRFSQGDTDSDGIFELRPEWHIVGFLGSLDGPLWNTSWCFKHHYFVDDERLAQFLREEGFNPPKWNNSLDVANELIRLDREYYSRKYGIAHPTWAWGLAMDVDFGVVYPDKTIDIGEAYGDTLPLMNLGDGELWGDATTLRLFNAADDVGSFRFDKRGNERPPEGWYK